MGKKLLLVLLVMCSALSAAAADYDFSATYNGKTIYYKKYGSDKVWVAPKYQNSTSNSSAYAGNITIPSTVTYGGVTYSVVGIYIAAFEYCSGLTSVSIPSSVTEIMHSAFSRCTGLTSINIPSSVTSVGDYAFDGCTGLTSVTIPYGTTKLRYTFSDCTNLKSVSIPSSVTEIGVHSFDNCSSLTSITIPAGVTSIYTSANGGGVFDGCTKLKTVYNYSKHLTVTAGSSDNGGVGLYATNVLNLSDLTKVQDCYYSLNNGSYTFEFCDSPNSLISIPSSVNGKPVVGIGDCAFSGNTVLKSVEIPSTIQSIGSGAFNGCTNLKTVYNNSSYLTVTKGATSNGYVGYYADLVANRNYVLENDAYYILNDGCYTLNEYVGDAKKFVVPSSINDSPVTAIAENVFKGNTSLVSVQIPSSIQSIGTNVFYGCSNLIKVVLDGNTVPDGIATAFNTVVGRQTYVSNSAYDSYASKLGTINVYSNLSSRFVVDGVEYIPVPASRTAVAFDCDYSTAVINVPSTVTFKNVDLAVSSIAPQTFRSHSSMTSFTVGGAVPSIGADAFTSCSGLALFTIEEGVSPIAFSASLSGLPITDLSIGRDVTYTTSPFTNLAQLTTLYVLGSTTNIQTGEFTGCSALQTLGTAGTVNSIGDNAFKDFANLSDISIDGVSLAIGANAFQGCTKLNNVTIEGGVASIGNYAFSGCTGMKRLVVNSGVTTIGNYAFSGCTSLANVTLPSTISTYGAYCFYLCKSIATPLRISNTQPTNIGTGAFAGCSAIPSVTIGNGCQTIGQAAFQDCTSVTSVSIGSGCTLIYNVAFKGCTSLRTVTLGSNLGGIAGGAFQDCTSITSIVIPDKVTAIDLQAFNGCTQLSSITLPASLASIGPAVFQNCSALTSISIPNAVTVINENTFNGCTALTEVTLPSSLATIGNAAFLNTTSLSAIELPATVTAIGANAFNGSGITSLSLPNGVLTVSEGVFANTNSLQTVNLNKATAIEASAFEKSSIQSLTIPASVLTIADGAFNDCSSLKDLTIVAAAKKITLGKNTAGQGLFYDCGIDNLYIGRELSYSATQDAGYSPFYGNTKLKNVHMGEKAITIPENMFAECTALTKVTLDVTITSMDASAFKGSGVQTINFPAKLKSIANNAFQNCTRLRTLTIPESVTTIGKYAFSGSGLETVTLPSTLATIDEYVFANTASLQTVNISEGTTSIATNAFNGSALPKITIPKTVITVGNAAFKGCTKLAELIIADGPENLAFGYNATNQGLFYDCKLTKLYQGRNLSYSTSALYGTSPFYASSTLKEVELGDIPTTVNSKQFYNCTALETVKIGDSATSIQDYAFSGCTALTTFSVGASIEEIGEEAFSDCTALDELRTYATIPPYCGDQALGDIKKFECTLYVPKGSEIAYAAADQWKEFFFVETFDAGVAVSYIELSSTNATLNVGQTMQLTAEAYPESALVRAVNWSSSDPSIADVNVQGIVAAYAAGTATITATAKDGSGVTAACVITVFDPNAPVPYRFSIADTNISKNAVVLVPVSMDNEQGITSFQCDIHLPSGLGIAKNEYDIYAFSAGERLDGTFVFTSADYNDAVRLAVYSSQNHVINGSEGTIFYIPIEVTDQSASEGSEYQILINGIYVTLISGFEEKAVPDINGTLTIGSSYNVGDVNNDGRISIADVSMAVSYVLGGNPSNGIFEAADANGDNRISIADVSMIVSYLLSGRPVNAPQHAIGQEDGIDIVEYSQLSLSAEGKLVVEINNLCNYTSAQFDIVLPAGMRVKGITLSEENASSHAIAYREYEDGSVRFLAYSGTNANFRGDNVLAEITLSGSADGFAQFAVENVYLAEAIGYEIEESAADGCTVEIDTTGLSGIYVDGMNVKVEGNGIVVEAEKDGVVIVVDMLGRVRQYSVSAGTNRISLVAGVYLVNNTKVIIK